MQPQGEKQGRERDRQIRERERGGREGREKRDKVLEVNIMNNVKLGGEGWGGGNSSEVRSAKQLKTTCLRSK